MSTPVPIIISATPTVAMVKIARAVAESNPSTVAKRTGSTGNTIRLLIAGAVAPTSRTIERFRVLSIEPADWFRKAQGSDSAMELKPEPTAIIEPTVVASAGSF